MNFNLHKIRIQLYGLAIVCAFLTSCKAQVKPNIPVESPVSGTAFIQPKASQSIIQDQNGDIWYIDSLGVTVYAPTTNIFKHYTEKDGLSSNRINSILEDNKGVIWLAAANGINTYENGKFSIFAIPTVAGPLNYAETGSNGYAYNENYFNCILQDSKGILWFGNKNGIDKFDGKNYTHFTVNDGVQNNTGYAISDGIVFGPESIIEDSSGKIWFGGRGADGLFCYDGHTLNHYNVDSTNWIRPLMQTSNGDLWFNARLRPTLYVFNGKSFTSFSSIELKDWVFTMVEDNNKNLWFNNGKNDGVTFYDGKTCINYTTEIGVVPNASNFFCTGILKDKEGNIWFKSLSTELCKYDTRQNDKVGQGKTFVFFKE